MGLCVPFTSLDVCVERLRGSGVMVLAQNMHREESGAFTGEVSAAMLAELGVDGVVLGHSERREYNCETDRALQQKVPAALAAGLHPILCVGETEEERERGETRAQAAPPGAGGRSRRCRAERLAEVTIAYEPIWAIGTGRVATPELAQDAIAFVRALVGGPLERGGRAQVRVLSTAAASSPTTPRRSWPSPTWTARWWAARAWTRRASRGSWPRRGSERPAERAWSSSTAGGWPSRGPGTRSSWPTRRCSTSCGSAGRTPPSRPGARRSGLPEGQMGNSEVGHLNLGAGAIVKQDLIRIDEAIEDGSFAENEVLRAACDAERLHLLGLVSAGGVHASMGHLEALLELARREGVEDVVIHAFTDGRDTNPDSGAGYIAEVEDASRRAGRARGVGDRPLLRDGPRPALGPHRARGEGARRRARPSSAADSGEAAVRAAYERGETDEFIKPTLVGGDGRIRPGDGVIFFNFRPDRRAPAHRGAVAELSGRRDHDADRVPGGLGPPGRVPARAAGGDAGEHAGRRAGCRSCTWPRPRSTPT